jgi:hypothetical protein
MPRQRQSRAVRVGVLLNCQSRPIQTALEAGSLRGGPSLMSEPSGGELLGHRRRFDFDAARQRGSRHGRRQFKDAVVVFRG